VEPARRAPRTLPRASGRKGRTISSMPLARADAGSPDAL
jgi:hypothetical protein